MRFLVIFSTLLAAAIAAKLSVYSVPTPQQSQPSVGTALPGVSTKPSGPPPIQGHVGQNDLTQTYEPAGSHVLQQPQGPTGHNDLTQTFGGPTRPQEPLQFQGPTGQDVFIQTFGELSRPQELERPQNLAGQDVLPQSFEGHTQPHGPAQPHRPAGQDGQTHPLVRPTRPDDLTQTYEGPEVLYRQPQHQGPDGQEAFGGPATEPQGPTQHQGPADPVLSSGCLQGEVLHADGSCVVPEVTRDVYIFSIPETPRRPKRPLPRLPAPKVHEHVLFIRTPEGGDGPEPLLVPPPAQKSVVYVLRKESNDEEQRLIQVPAPPPAQPEVFFINYKDGDNSSLPGGFDLQQVLQTTAQASPSLLDAAPSSNVVEAPEKIYSGPGGHIGDDIALGGHINDNLALEGHSDVSTTLEDHSDGTPALGGHRDGNLFLGGHSSDNSALEVHTEGNFGFVKHIDDDLSLEGHSDDDFVLGGHTDDDISLEGHSDFAFVFGGHTDDDISLKSHSDDEYGLGGHNNGGLVLESHNNNGVFLGGPSNIALNVPGDESFGHGLNSDAPAGFEIQNGGVLDNDHTQTGGNGGHAIPARLLSASFGSRVNSFNGFTDSKEEAAARGVEDTVSADAIARLSGPVYRPTSNPPTAPGQHYAQP